MIGSADAIMNTSAAALEPMAHQNCINAPAWIERTLPRTCYGARKLDCVTKAGIANRSRWHGPGHVKVHVACNENRRCLRIACGKRESLIQLGSGAGDPRPGSPGER